MASSLRLTCGPVQLRLIGTRHAHQLFTLARDPELSRHLQWPPHRSMADSLGFIHDAAALYKQRAAFLLGIFEGEHGPLLGATGISHLDRTNRRGEVGSWIGIPYQRQGLNRYAKAAVFALGFGQLGLTRLEMLVRTDNPRSLAAMRSLSGVVDEGVQRSRLVSAGATYDAHMFALVRSEYAPGAYPPVAVIGGLP